MIILAAFMLALSLCLMFIVGRWNESARYHQGYDDGMTAQRNYDAGYIEQLRLLIPKRGARGRFVGRK